MFFLRLNRTKLKFKNLYLIIMNIEKTRNKDNLLFKSIIFARLQSFVNDFNRSNNFLSIKVIINLKNFSELLIFINEIYQRSLYRRSNLKSIYNNINLKVEPSNDELLLLHFKCFNSFSAQFLLEQSSILEIVSMKYEDFLKNFNIFDKRQVDYFFDTLAKKL
jgi:hypothetical protein